MRVLLGVLLLLACRSSLAFAPAPACFSMRATLLQSYRRRLETGMTAVTMAVAGGKKSALLKGIKKPKGTIAIMAEVKRRDPGTAGLEFPIPSVQELSQSLNDAKVQSIAVWTDEQDYGTSLDDLATVVKVQAKFRGNFPGPSPVLMLTKTASVDDVSAASAAGAAGLLFSAITLDADALSAGVKSCTDAGIEAVVLCRDREQVAKARASGAKVVALDSKFLGIDASIELADSGEGVDVLMALGGIKALDDAWKLRDAGFGCVVVGEELMATVYGRPGEVRQGGGVDGLNAAVCKGDTIRQNDINTFIKALGAKASVKFGPTGVNSFRDRGAKSYRHYIVE